MTGTPGHREESRDNWFGPILFKCKRHTLNQIHNRIFGCPLFLSVLLYLKVSVLAAVFVGVPISLGLERLGLSRTGVQAWLAFSLLCSFGFFAWCFFIAPARQRLWVCERGLLVRKGYALASHRVAFDLIERVVFGDTGSTGSGIFRGKKRATLAIERMHDKPLKIEGFTSFFTQKTIGELIDLLHNGCGLSVIEGNMKR